MKYVISWRERPAASSREYEAAHERVLEIFKDWKMPAFKVEPVVDVMDAVAVEVKAIDYRKKNFS